MRAEIRIRDRGVRLMLRQLARRAEYLQPAFRKIHSEVLIRSFFEQFEREGDPTRWAGLAPATIAHRRKGPGPGPDKILQDTRILLWSWTGGHGHFLELKRTGMVTGSEIPYAARHQEGGGKTPQREIVAREQDVERAARILEDYIATGRR